MKDLIIGIIGILALGILWFYFVNQTSEYKKPKKRNQLYDEDLKK